MNFGRVMLIILLVALFAGCSSMSREAKRVMDSPVIVDSEVTESAAWDAYSSYTWVPAPASAVLQQTLKDPEVRGHIRDVVESEMFERGYRQVPNDPDLLINYHVAIQDIDEDVINDLYNGTYLPEYRMEFSGPKKSEREWKEGTLILFLFDTRTQQMVWRASVQTEVTDENVPLKVRQDRLTSMLKEMMKKIPKRS